MMLRLGLIVAVLCGLCWATRSLADDLPSEQFDFAPIPDLPDDPSVKRLFFDEYPAAAERLADSMKRVTGIATLHIRDQESSSERFLHFRHFDDHLSIRRSRSKAVPDARDEALLINPHEVAMVRAPLTSGATPVMEGNSLNRRSEIFRNTNWRRYGEATFAVDGMRISQRLQSGDWKYVRGHRDPSNPELVVIHFTFRVPEWIGSPVPYGPVDVVFDRASGWAVRRFYLHSLPFHFVLRGELETVRIEKLGIAPRRLQMGMREIEGTQPVDASQLLRSPVAEATVCTYDVLSPLERYAAEDFSLGSLGVTHGFSTRRWALILIGNGLLLMLLLLGLVLIRRRRTAVP